MREAALRPRPRRALAASDWLTARGGPRGRVPCGGPRARAPCGRPRPSVRLYGGREGPRRRWGSGRPSRSPPGVDAFPRGYRSRFPEKARLWTGCAPRPPLRTGGSPVTAGLRYPRISIPMNPAALSPAPPGLRHLLFPSIGAELRACSTAVPGDVTAQSPQTSTAVLCALPCSPCPYL